MKKFLLLNLICVSLIFCTGCTKTTCDIEINNQNEITITKTQGVKLQNKFLPKGFYETLENDMAKLTEKYSTEDNKLTPFINEYSAGVITKNEKIAFEELNKFLPKGYEAVNNNAFQIKKNFFTTTYSFNVMFDPIVASKYVPEYYEEFKKSSQTVKKFDTKLISFASNNVLVDNSSSNILTIKIPKKAKKHNATTVISNTEYQWDLSELTKPTLINIEYSKFNFLP